MVDDDLIRQLRAIAPTKTDEPLARHTTFGIGGAADAFVTVRNAVELELVVRVARQSGQNLFVLGSGSNVLIGDRGVRGVVVANRAREVQIRRSAKSEIRQMRNEQSGDRLLGDQFTVWAESGTRFAALARRLVRQGYAGVEWAVGIPGTIGGAVVNNAGAYEGSVAEVLRAVTLVDNLTKKRHVSPADLELAYRTSSILSGKYIGSVVLSVEIAVSAGSPTELTAKVAKLNELRIRAQPRGRNSGSTFKNPLSDSAWHLIEMAQLRNHRIGDACFSNTHSNFIENLGAARASDVYALIQEARGRVRAQFGVDLELEIQLVGEGFN